MTGAAGATTCPDRDHRRPRRGRVTAFLAVTAASLTGNAIVAVVVPWLVLTRTGSPTQAGLVGAVALATAVPALLFGGPLIDRWGKRRVSVVADALSALAVAALPLLDAVIGLTLVSTLALVAVGAVFDAPGAAAREAARPAVAAAGGRSLAAVNGAGEAVDGIAQIAGPALAGVGLGLFGAMVPLWAASALLFAAALAGAYALPRDQPAGRGGQSGRRGGLTGVRLVWSDPTLRAGALLGTFGIAVISPLALILGAHLAPGGRGGMLGAVLAALGFGSVLGSAAYPWIAGRLRRRSLLIGGLCAAAACFTVMAGVLTGGGGDLPLIVSAAGAGAAIGPLTPAVAAMTQERTEPAVLGRVVSVIWSFALLAGPLALFATGLLLDAAPPAVAMAVVGGGLLCTAGYAARAPGLRHIDP